jgi:transcriptional regulator with XRE-family HTH domain
MLALMAKRKQEAFADDLKAARKAAGHSAYRLARMSGLTRQAVSRLELGLGEPNWETVQALAPALGVSTDVFVTREPEPPPDPPKRGRRRRVS